jgi:hypothetical protein
MPCRTPGAAWRPYEPDPRSGAGHDRQHRLRGDLATHRHNGRDQEQWEYEVTSGGRIRYVTDDQHRTVWLTYASPRHPKDTDPEQPVGFRWCRNDSLSSRDQSLPRSPG